MRGEDEGYSSAKPRCLKAVRLLSFSELRAPRDINILLILVLTGDCWLTGAISESELGVGFLE